MTTTTFHGAVVVPSADRPFIGYRCPWCESVHIHGLGDVPPSAAAGTTFVRGSHCPEGRSPLAGRGVSIHPARLVRSCDVIEPPGPHLARRGGAGRETLRELVQGRELEAVVARHLFDQASTAEAFEFGRVFEVELVGGSLRFEDGGRWNLENEISDALAAGDDLLGLLGRLFGTGPGVVFVRVASAALGVDLAPTTALEVADAIDRQFITPDESEV